MNSRRSRSKRLAIAKSAGLNCSRCGGDHTFRVCPQSDRPLFDVKHRIASGSPGKILFDAQAGGRVLPMPSDSGVVCECRGGMVLRDADTRRVVGFERFYFDSDEERYYLDGEPLSAADLKNVDWATPRFVVEPTFVRDDGRIHGTIAAYEYCELCEHVKKMKAGAVIRWPVLSPSGRRRYLFEFGPLANPKDLRAFNALEQNVTRGRLRDQRDFLISCLLFFGLYSQVPRYSERALAKRFRVSRPRIQYLRKRYRKLLLRSAVPQ